MATSVPRFLILCHCPVFRCPSPIQYSQEELNFSLRQKVSLSFLFEEQQLCMGFAGDAGGGSESECLR